MSDWNKLDNSTDGAWGHAGLLMVDQLGDDPSEVLLSTITELANMREWRMGAAPAFSRLTAYVSKYGKVYASRLVQTCDGFGRVSAISAYSAPSKPEVASVAEVCLGGVDGDYVIVAHCKDGEPDVVEKKLISGDHESIVQLCREAGEKLKGGYPNA